MTSLTIWAGWENRGQSSLNLASDSRITFANGECWDQARKIFASRRLPVMMGFVGDVMFPYNALTTVLSRMDIGFFSDDLESAVQEVVVAIEHLWRAYPVGQRFKTEIFVAYRLESGMGSEFKLVNLSSPTGSETSWTKRRISMPSTSANLVIRGSGANSVRAASDVWATRVARGTSRAVFSALVDSIRSGADPSSGGAPQVASLHRIGPAKAFGVIYGDKRYFEGAYLVGTEQLPINEFRGELFERRDGVTKHLLSGAQVHTRH